MQKAFRLSLACLMSAALVNAAALASRAQEITLSANLLEYCAAHGMNGPSCACFIDAMIDKGRLPTSGEITQDEFDGLFADHNNENTDENTAVAATCIANNP